MKKLKYKKKIKNKKRQYRKNWSVNTKHYKSKYINAHLSQNEEIITKIKNSTLSFYFIIILFAIATILFPRTIIEFFFRENKTFFFALIANIIILFLGIYLVCYFISREIYLTNRRIFGKSGIFNVKKVNIPLNRIENIDIFGIRALEISTPNKIYTFDYISNAETFRISTIYQVQKLINEANDEQVLLSFSRSMNKKLEEYKLEERFPNMTCCKCCKQMISKESTYCVHCGQPLPENEREADFTLKLFCFLLPPLGILVFLIHIGSHQKMAKQCLEASLLSLFIIAVLYLSIANVLEQL